MTFQAWLDDSGTKGDGKYMAVAGLFGEAQTFATVADDWDKHLRAMHPGAIRYFKMSEATTLSGEFNYWREDNRDEKVRQMARVIDRPDLSVLPIRLDLAAFEKYAKQWGAKGQASAANEPYLFLFQGALSMTLERRSVAEYRGRSRSSSTIRTG